MNKILIADSGSTKTDWALLDKLTGNVLKISGTGINPVIADEESIRNNMEKIAEEYPEIKNPDLIYFYGAGCATPNICERVALILSSAFGCGKVMVLSDLVGAARSLLGKDAGIACILGTGSNSCLYNGKEIVSNVPSLGYVLGDEGSGACLGKRLLSDAFKGLLPSKIKSRLEKEFDLTLAELLNRVYRNPKPNQFLASFVRFISDNIEEPEIYALVKDEFERFFKRNLNLYEGISELPICFTGSIAYHFATILIDTAKSQGLNIVKIIKSPIEGLIEYHLTYG